MLSIDATTVTPSTVAPSTVAPSTVPERTATVAADKVEGADAFIQQALGKNAIEFGNYWPSFLSSITLTVDPGDTSKVDKISEFEFDVKFSRKV
jgi:hypothetical protein